MDKANQADVHWLRSSSFSWKAIEPVRTSPDPTYNWAAVNGAGLIEAFDQNLTVIGVIKYTPSWAQKESGVSCGPIKADAFDEFYEFVYNAVSIYSQPPYNIRYWEFGNEPDVDAELVDKDSVYGCWGDDDDPYYGGRYYGEMLKYAYPAVKAANPVSQVLIGGLLLVCDPIYFSTTNCLPAQFLKGILLNQGASHFDIVSFHSYIPFAYGKIYDEQHQHWAARGGQVVGKISFIRSVMAEFQISKPIIMTEVALNCTYTDCTNPSETFKQAQADFLVSAFVRTWKLNLWGTVWYTLEQSDWAQTGLFSGTTPKPGYNALSFMTTELKDAAIGPEITQYSGLRGYEFSFPSKIVWVLWAPDGATGKQITLPANVSTIYNKFGNPIEPIPSTITIISPIYIEFLR